MYMLDNLKNNFDFFLRSHITFSRKNYTENADDISDIAVPEDLKQKYNIALFEPSTTRLFLENIYFLMIFNKYFSKHTLDNVSVLDIGSKNWSYVKSEFLFFQSFTKAFNLSGIELDAYRLNSKFYTRYEVAKYYTQGLFNTNYIVGDFLKHTRKYDYIIWILPFVSEYPLIRWGLPLKYFNPESMLLHAYDLLNRNGELLIINQGENEYNIQLELNKKLNLHSENYGQIEDKYDLFKNKRYCSKIIKV